MSISRIFLQLTLVTASLMPLLAFAQPTQGFGAIGQTVRVTLQFINSYLVPLVFGLAFLMFLWGVFMHFFWEGGSAEARENGKQLMAWAVVAFVVMVSVWGLVNVIAWSLGFNNPNPPTLPRVPGV